MTRIIAISNHKGGVGKTTTTVNLSAGLARAGKKVLAIDTDPQANLTQSLGLVEPQQHTIYGALRGDYGLKPVALTDNLHLIPSTLDLAGIELEIASKIARESILRKLLAPIVGQYDFILIDCPPSLGLITVNAFAAATEIFIPLQAEYLALHGLDKLIEAAEIVRQNINANLKITGVIVTLYDSRKVLNRDIAESVEEKEIFKGKVFKTYIRDNVALAEAPTGGTSVFDYAARSHGAKDYAALVKEVLEQK